MIAPIPWFPLITASRGGLPPLKEEIAGIRVLHPRFFYTPGCRRNWHYVGYRRSAMPILRRDAADPTFRDVGLHVILGFAYPDAVAMAPVCRKLGLDYSVLVLGSDFRIASRTPRIGEMIMAELQAAPHVFCPGKALKADMVAAGLEENKIQAFNNGVDKDVFHPPQTPNQQSALEVGGPPPMARLSSSGRATSSWRFNEEGMEAGGCASTKPLRAKSGPGLPRRSVLFVGNLVPVKAPARAIDAVAELAEDGVSCRLDIVGDGPLRKRLQRQARNRHVDAAFHGRLQPEGVAEMMRQASCLILTSRSEGMPNVVLEALACGTPVVATGVGEVPYVVKDGENGYVVAGGAIDGANAESDLVGRLSAALERALNTDWDPQAISETVAGFTWQAAAQAIVDALT